MSAVAIHTDCVRPLSLFMVVSAEVVTRRPIQRN
jgi:hypothetical protein